VTPPLYTDADLRSEAAHCLLALSSTPTVPDILRSLPGTYIDSYREDDGSGQTWGDVLDNAGLADAARKIHALIGEASNAVGGINSAHWLIGLGADQLEAAPQTVEIGWTDGPLLARVLIAFDKDMPDDERQQLAEDIRDAIAPIAPIR
jgi:hypothetical protein